MTARVDRSLAGDAPARLTFWTHGGRLGDRLRIVHGQARVSQGETVVLFLFRGPTGALWPTALGRGKWQVFQHDGAAYARPSAPLEGLGARDAAEPLQLPLADLEARVRAARGARP